jgi:uncharacterized membrane protein
LSFHRIFDVIVLVATLLGGASAVLLVVGPLAFESVSGPLRTRRRLLLALVVMGIGLFLLEWLVIH